MGIAAYPSPMLSHDQPGPRPGDASANDRIPAAPLAADPDAQPESMVVQMGSGERIHYLDWGTPPMPGPTLLLLHGIASTGWSWAPVARRLHGQLRVLALDMRGHGLSEGARSGLDLDSLAWDALTVLAANGAGVEADGPPAIIAGHGLGAMVAATAARTPARVGGGCRPRRWGLGGPRRIDPAEPRGVPRGTVASRPR